MAFSDEDIQQLRLLIREEIDSALTALFVSARIQDFGKVLTPELEVRVKEVLANIECNVEKV